MERFYRLNSGNDNTAEENAVMYITMIVNEMSYRYQTLKEMRLLYRGGILDLAVNPSVIIYPEKGQDLEFIEKNGTFVMYSKLKNFANYVNATPPEAPWHHAMLKTGLNMFLEFDRLGEAYVLTVCSQAQPFKDLPVLISEARNYDLLHLAAPHELGHALGAASHDDVEKSPRCQPDRYIMSPNANQRKIHSKDSPGAVRLKSETICGGGPTVFQERIRKTLKKTSVPVLGA